MQTQSYASAASSPRRASPYWVVTLSETTSGFLVHETRGTKRRLVAMFVDEEGDDTAKYEAEDYLKRRASKPWRITAEA